MEQVIEIAPESQASIVEAEKMALQYNAYKVVSNESLLFADSDLTKVKSRMKALEQERLDITKPIDAAKKKIMDLYRRPIEALAVAQSIINRAMSAYRDEQESIRREQERKCQEAARKEEEIKRKALEARAAKAAANGKADKAEELLEKAQSVFVPAPVIQSTVVETKNKPRDVWKYEVIDINAVPREYMCIDDTKTGQVVRATKGTLAIPGLRIYREDSKF